MVPADTPRSRPIYDETGILGKSDSVGNSVIGAVGIPAVPYR
jgi:hypothetical protein